MSLFHLEKNAPQASNPASLCGVYWSARDMDNASPLGNHHFITFVYKNEAQADRLTKKWKALFPAIGYGMGFWTQQNEKKKPVYFSSMGFGRKDGNLSPNFNHKADCKALREVIDPKNQTSWRKPDYDYEGHRMPYAQAVPPYIAPDAEEKLMDAVVQRFANFDFNYKAGKRYSYSLVNANCATVINTVFKLVGYPKNQRELLGEFSGIDWGEEKAIPDDLFAPPARPWKLSDRS